MASSFSASCSPEKTPLTSSNRFNSLGNVHDALAPRVSLHQGSQADISPSSHSLDSPSGSISSSSSWTKTSKHDSHSSDCSVDLHGDMALNFNLGEPTHKWQKLSSCEEFVGTKRSKHTIVAWNDRIYVFGGDNGRRMLNDFLVSHIHDSSWARVVYTGQWEMRERNVIPQNQICLSF